MKIRISISRNTLRWNIKSIVKDRMSIKTKIKIKKFGNYFEE